MAFLVGIGDATVDQRPLMRLSWALPWCDPGRVTSALDVELEAPAHPGGESTVPMTRAGSPTCLEHFLARPNSGTAAASLPGYFSDPARVSPRRAYCLCEMKSRDARGGERRSQRGLVRCQNVPAALFAPRDPGRVTTFHTVQSPVSASGQIPYHAWAASSWIGFAVAADVKDYTANAPAELGVPRPDPARVTPQGAGLAFLETRGTARTVAGVTRPGSCQAASLAGSGPVGGDPALVTEPLAAVVPIELAVPTPGAEGPTRPGSPTGFQRGLGRAAASAVAPNQPDVIGAPSPVTQRPGAPLPAGRGSGFTPGGREAARATFGRPRRGSPRSGVLTGHTRTQELLTRPGSCLLPSNPSGLPGASARIVARSPVTRPGSLRLPVEAQP